MAKTNNNRTSKSSMGKSHLGGGGDNDINSIAPSIFLMSCKAIIFYRRKIIIKSVNEIEVLEKYL
jgi:hypothetical protein